MKANIIRACDMIAVPRKLLFDPKLSLSAKGVAGALLTFNDGDCSTAELAELSGISEKTLITYLDELVARGYASHCGGVYSLLEVI